MPLESRTFKLDHLLGFQVQISNTNLLSLLFPTQYLFKYSLLGIYIHKPMFLTHPLVKSVHTSIVHNKEPRALL